MKKYEINVIPCTHPTKPNKTSWAYSIRYIGGLVYTVYTPETDSWFETSTHRTPAPCATRCITKLGASLLARRFLCRLELNDKIEEMVYRFLKWVGEELATTRRQFT